MKDKPYSLGIIVGRFQTLHTGHEMIIEKAIELCGETGIFIGSSQESGTNKNPFTYEQRKELLLNVFGDRIKVFPLPDLGVGNVAAWGDYVLMNVKERFGRYPDIFISGRESRRVDWFDNAEGLCISELYIPKSIDISASEMREHFINNDRAAWEKYSNPANYGEYEKLRQAVLLSKDNLETESI